MASDINASIVELSVSIDANTTALGIAVAAFTSGVTSIVHGLASIDCSGCPPNGTYPPTDGIDEEQPPPAGFETYDPVIDDRKCKLANMYFDDLRTVINFFYVNDIDTLGAVGMGSITALLGVIAGILAAGPVSWGLGALGAIAAIIVFFIVESIDLFNLLAIMDANQDELVCSLYEATTPEAGKTAFKAILASGGADVTQLALIDAVNMVVALEVLFFKPDGTEGDNIEARLDGYVATVDCELCVSLDSCVLGFACLGDPSQPLGSGDLTQNGLSRVLTSEERDVAPGQHAIAIGCGGLDWREGAGPPDCGSNDNPTFNWEVIGPTPFPLSFNWQDNASFSYRCEAGVLVHQGSPPFPPYPEDYPMVSTYLKLIHNAPFTINIKLS